MHLLQTNTISLPREGLIGPRRTAFPYPASSLPFWDDSLRFKHAAKPTFIFEGGHKGAVALVWCDLNFWNTCHQFFVVVNIMLLNLNLIQRCCYHSLAHPVCPSPAAFPAPQELAKSQSTSSCDHPQNHLLMRNFDIYQLNLSNTAVISYVHGRLDSANTNEFTVKLNSL